MQNYLRKASQDRRSERYIEVIGSKTEDQLFLLCLCSSLLFYNLISFSTSLQQQMIFNKLLVQAVLFQSLKFLDSPLQIGVNATFFFFGGYSFFQRRHFLTNSHQRGFFIPKCTPSIFKFVGDFKKQTRKSKSKKALWKLWCHAISFVKGKRLNHALCQKQ